MDERSKRPIWHGLSVQAAIFAVFLLYGGIKRNALLLILTSLIFVARCIFLSRQGSSLLREMQLELRAAVRNDLRYEVSFRRVLGYTMMACSPFYCFWVLVGLLGAVVGSDGWLLYAFPTLFISCTVFKLISDHWRELGVKRIKFWLIQLGLYILSLVPTVIASVDLW